MSGTWQTFLNVLRYGAPSPAPGAEDIFVSEGREAARQGCAREDCPHYDGSDGQHGWLSGFDLEQSEIDHGASRDSEDQQSFSP